MHKNSMALIGLFENSTSKLLNSILNYFIQNFLWE